MRTKPIIFFVLVGFIAGYFTYSEATRQGARPGIVSVGDPAPDFSIKDESGNTVKLSDYRGKVVFLNFWATWCEPCIKEAPGIEVINNTFKSRKFQMLTISSDTQWSAVRKFHRNHGVTFPVLLDPGQQVSRYEYKTTGLPETFLIDSNGFVVKHTYVADWSSPSAVSLIAQLISDAEERP